MAIRKVFFNSDGSELTYRVENGKLSIAISGNNESNDHTYFPLDHQDALSLISELNKIKKDLLQDLK